MTSELNFAGLGLAQPLLRAVAEAGYTTPTPIQAQAIPLVLQGGDLLAAAQTGTGKTAGFTLPILQRLSESSAGARPGRPRCLVLVPTRELAAQVEDAVRTYGKYMPMKSVVVFGGVGIFPQIKALRGKVDILVATPGRLLDHAGQRTVDLSAVEVLVLDEADRMLDMGFIRDIKRILAMLPAKRQNLLFSATFSEEIRGLADDLLDKPACVEVARRNATAELVEQKVHLVPSEHKRGLLSHLIRHHDWRQVLVFTRTKHGANRLAQQLAADGIGAEAIHGNKSQAARTRALAQFKAGKLPVLVATDIAARGLDIDQLPQVVNFDLPHVAEDYVHRIGRTGRAGSTGAALSLVASDEMKLLTGIERLIKRSIERATVSGYAMTATPRPAPRPAQQARPAPGGGHRPPNRGRPAPAHREAHASRAEPGNRVASGNRAPESIPDDIGNRAYQPGDRQRAPGALAANGNVHRRSGATAQPPQGRHAAPGQRRERPGQRSSGNAGQPGSRRFGGRG